MMNLETIGSALWNVSALLGLCTVLAIAISYFRGFDFSLRFGTNVADIHVVPEDDQLKSWPEFFAYLWDGSKTFELRVNDRDFQEGDQYYIREWLPDRLDNGDPDPSGAGAYSGRILEIEITYVLSLDMLKACGLDTGRLDKEWCVFSFEELRRNGSDPSRFLELGNDS